jgi:hypothetical protein
MDPAEMMKMMGPQPAAMDEKMMDTTKKKM